ncbi:CDK-activating kinase assembly factor MAT1-domain-containing protein [Xylariaceae sp. FL0016]|nr:CDK-activating kinase assembly factor MAT1-domain-containing protein [Xylariaceae sp. FL0016]
MSRKPTSTSVVKPTSAPSSSIPSDVCPVCRRVRYLNTDMEFLINPDCYHPMCSNCVEHIFKSGPAQCPYASCTKTLRHKGFRAAFFGDLSVEREVDIRRRVAAAYNNVEEDFETLRDWNNYLQDVEDLTFDLISGGDAERAAAEQKLLAREQTFKDEIERNRRRGRDQDKARKEREAAEQQAARERRAEEAREEARAREAEAAVNREVMDALARGDKGSAEEITRRIVSQNRARVAAISGAHFPSLLDSETGPLTAKTNMLSIRGLKQRPAMSADDEDASKPYDPFAGLSLKPARYDAERNESLYPNTWLQDARAREDHRVPGYSVQEYVSRALFDAFAGLGVSIEDDKADAARAIGTVGAEAAAATGKTGVEDVFA